MSVTTTTRPAGFGRFRFGVELAVNVVLPWLVYEALVRRGWTEIHALLAVTVVPLVWGLAVLLRERRCDPVAILSGGGMLLSLVAGLLSSDVRALQVRESYVTLLIGLLFLGSALVRRPLLTVLALSQVRAQGHSEEVASRLEHPWVRQLLGTLNLGWGLVFVLEFLVRLWMIEVFSISTVLALGPWVQNAILGLAVLWSFWMLRRLQRRSRQAAAAQERVLQAGAAPVAASPSVGG